MITNNSDLCLVRVFKFKGRITAALVFSISLTPIIFLDILAVVRNQFDQAYFMFFWISLWFYILFGWLILNQKSNLRIDENGLQRFFFGNIWQSVSWSEVSVIREFSLFSQVERRVLRGFHVVPEKPPFFKFVFARKIVISETVDNFPEIIKMLDHYIDKHNIKVEIKANGEYQPIQKLEPAKDE